MASVNSTMPVPVSSVPVSSVSIPIPAFIAAQRDTPPPTRSMVPTLLVRRACKDDMYIYLRGPSAGGLLSVLSIARHNDSLKELEVKQILPWNLAPHASHLGVPFYRDILPVNTVVQVHVLLDVSVDGQSVCAVIQGNVTKEETDGNGIFYIYSNVPEGLAACKIGMAVTRVGFCSEGTVLCGIIDRESKDQMHGITLYRCRSLRALATLEQSQTLGLNRSVILQL